MEAEDEKGQSEINRELYSKINCLKQDLIGLQERYNSLCQNVSDLISILSTQSQNVTNKGKRNNRKMK